VTVAGAQSAGPTWAQLLTALVERRDLTADQASWAMDSVMAGEAIPSRLGAFLVGLRGKGETVDEITGLVASMLRHAVRIEVPGPTVDIVGTGGDRHRTVNISTMAALVTAGAGRRVVKHGNRAASSASGSADVLESLGVRLDLSPQRVAELATEVGITFCFAQRFHPAFRHAGPTRSELGIATAFNFLGPLTNPAQPKAGAIGVADARMAAIMAGVLAARGASALVFRGEEGLDELSTTAPTRVWVVSDAAVSPTTVDALDLGLPRATLDDLRGGDAAANAAVVRSVLAGDKGPVRDAVLLNAAAGLVAVDGAGRGPLPQLLATALVEAAESVDSGAAAGVLERWVSASQA
jgi:anthranilate phosphoribosyltransferase